MKLKLTVLLIVLMIPSCVYSKNWTTMLDQIRANINDKPVGSTDTAKYRVSDADLLVVANDGQRLINDTVWALNTSTRIVMITATTYYDLPTDFITTNRVILSMKTILPERTIAQLDSENSYWFTASTGTPSYYYISWNRKQIGFYQVADTSYIVDIDYFQQPTDMVSGSDIPFNGVNKFVPYHDLIVWYTCAYQQTVDNKPNAQMFFTLWSSGVTRMAQQLNVTPNNIPFIGGRKE